MIDRAKVRGSHGSVIRTGLWHAAPVVLFVMDLIYPLVTRTLWQFYTCQDLGKAGSWLEVSYDIQCTPGLDGEGNPTLKDPTLETYQSYSQWVWAPAVLFGFGVPILFHYLVRRYKVHGKSGDKVVASALEWLVRRN